MGFDELQEVTGAQCPLAGGTLDPLKEDEELALWFPNLDPGYHGAAYGK